LKTCEGAYSIEKVIFMKIKTIYVITIVLIGAILTGCAPSQRRADRIREQYPQWDQATVEKVSARRIEIGMTPEMVRASLGRPENTAPIGGEDRWGYAIDRHYGMGNVRRQVVFWVYFKDGKVVRTAGDIRQLGYWYYR
jgi:outer membrane protein assembly factor BamE (lipoprotein component of BamABCDE complex)